VSLPVSLPFGAPQVQLGGVMFGLDRGVDMSFARLGWPTADPVTAAPKRRTPRETPSIARPRDAVQLLAMQRLVGNRATASLVAVQRCGPIPADECPCNDGAESDGQERSQPAKGSPTADQHGPSGAPLQALEV
jgi:hypothetical protein